LITRHLDSKVGSLVNDTLSHLKRPKFPEEKAGKRYAAGIKDIIDNHFVKSDLQK